MAMRRGGCCDRCLSRLAEAVTLYEDDFLRGFTLPDSLSFDDWQFFEGEKLRGELALALERLARAYAARRQLEAAVRVSQRWLLLDTLNERAHELLMALLAAAGRRAEALRQYEECARLMREELGAEPAASTAAVRDAILAGRSPEVAADASVQTPRGAPAPDARQGAPGPRLGTAVAVRAVLPPGAAPLVALAQPVAEALGGTAQAVEEWLLVVFGARGARESDPEVAVRCAIEMRRELERVGVAARTGVQTGEVSADLGGPAAIASSRLAALAQPGQILVAESTFRLTRGSFSYLPTSSRSGGGRGTGVFAVRSALRVSTKTRGVEGLRSPMIGRDPELAALQALLVGAAAGKGAVACIVGEAGVGKSRLVHELRSGAREGGARHLWLEGRCLDVAQSTAYGPFLDMMRAQFAGREGVSLEAVNRVLRSLVVAGALAASRAAELGPQLASLFRRKGEGGPPAHAGRAVADDPESRRETTFLALRDFYTALSRTTPIVMVLEDLHWADSLSIGLASFLMESLASSAWLLICVYRPEQDHPCRHLATIASRACPQRHRELRLADLPLEESRRLAVSLLAGCELPPLVEELVLGRAQGNPFFLEETLRSLVDGGILRHDGRSWKAREAADEAPIPDSVRGVILGRVDRMDESSRGVLETASVIGSVFPVRLLARLLGPSARHESILRDLEDRALVYPARSLPETEYAFRHVLTRETVYAGIPESRRAALHGEVARAIEAIDAENRTDACEILAHHWAQAGDVGRATGYLLEAGRKAAASSANAEAVGHLSRALALLPRLPEGDSRDSRELELLVTLGVPLVQLHGHASADVGEHYACAERLCRKLGDRKRLFHALLGLRRHALVRGETRRALALSHELVEHARSACERARASFMLCEALLESGAPAQAVAEAEAALDVYDTERSLEQIREFGNDAFAGAGIMGGIGAWLAGRHETARRMGDLAVSRARAAGHPFNLAMTLYFAGWLRMLLGDDDAAAGCAAEVAALASGRFPLYALISANLGALLGARRSAGPRPAIEDLRRTTEEWGAAGNGLFLPRLLCSLGEAMGRAGESKAGLEAIGRGLAQSARSGERVWDAESLRVRGDLLKALSRKTEAARAYARSLAVARRQGALSFELRAALSLGRLLVAGRRGEDAVRLIRPVLDRFPAETDCADLDEAGALVADAAGSDRIGGRGGRGPVSAGPAAPVRRAAVRNGRKPWRR